LFETFLLGSPLQADKGIKRLAVHRFAAAIAITSGGVCVTVSHAS